MTASDARDELANLIYGAVNADWEGYVDAGKAADAILAAGWRPPSGDAPRTDLERQNETLCAENRLWRDAFDKAANAVVENWGANVSPKAAASQMGKIIDALLERATKAESGMYADRKAVLGDAIDVAAAARREALEQAVYVVAPRKDHQPRDAIERLTRDVLDAAANNIRALIDQPAPPAPETGCSHSGPWMKTVDHKTICARCGKEPNAAHDYRALCAMLVEAGANYIEWFDVTPGWSVRPEYASDMTTRRLKLEAAIEAANDALKAAGYDQLTKEPRK